MEKGIIWRIPNNLQRSNSRKLSHLDNPLGKVWSYNLNKNDIEINLMQEFFITKYKLTRPC